MRYALDLRFLLSFQSNVLLIYSMDENQSFLTFVLLLLLLLLSLFLLLL